jgi:hypothetical protein
VLFLEGNRGNCFSKIRHSASHRKPSDVLKQKCTRQVGWVFIFLRHLLSLSSSHFLWVAERVEKRRWGRRSTSGGYRPSVCLHSYCANSHTSFRFSGCCRRCLSLSETSFVCVNGVGWSFIYFCVVLCITMTECWKRMVEQTGTLWSLTNTTLYKVEEATIRLRHVFRELNLVVASNQPSKCWSFQFTVHPTKRKVIFTILLMYSFLLFSFTGVATHCGF